MSQGAERQQFTKEFKDDAVRLVLEQGYNCREADFPGEKQTYGSRRVVRELEKAGYNVARYQVRSLMRRLGLRAKTPRRYKVTTGSNHRILVYCR